MTSVLEIKLLEPSRYEIWERERASKKKKMKDKKIEHVKELGFYFILLYFLLLKNIFFILSWRTRSYGYRGRDCRNNLYLLPTGETVYFIASVVVLYNVEEQLQRHYTGHNDDVKWWVLKTGIPLTPVGRALAERVQWWDVTKEKERDLRKEDLWGKLFFVFWVAYSLRHLFSFLSL